MATTNESLRVPTLGSLDMPCYMRVLSFLSTKDKANFAMTNTTARAAVAATRNYHPETGDVLSEELHTAVMDVWNSVRCTVLGLKLADMHEDTFGYYDSRPPRIRFTKPSLEVSKTSPDAYHDAFVIGGAAYSQFFEDNELGGGVFHRFLSLLGGSSIEFQPRVIEDAPNWIRSSIFGHFYVFKKEEGGLIFVHVETLKVYVVKRTTNGDFINFDESKAPMQVRTTLYTVLDRYIVCDAFFHVFPLKYPTAATALLRNLKKIYMRALDSGEIHVSSSLEPFSKTGAGARIDLKAMFLTSDLREAALKETTLKLLNEYPAHRNTREVDASAYRMKHMNLLNHLRSLPVMPLGAGVWTFRRMGYTEHDNFRHQVNIMTASGQLVGFELFAKLVPTVDEYLLTIHKFCGHASMALDVLKFHKPHKILCDVLDIYWEIKALLEPIGIQVCFYPPPHDAEAGLYSEDHMPFVRYGISACAVCLEQSKDLNKCARCKYLIYCSREHQKLDWARHKGECYPADGAR